MLIRLKISWHEKKNHYYPFIYTGSISRTAVIQSRPRISQAAQAHYQGHNEVYGIKDQKGGIWDHRPWIGISPFLENQGSGSTIFVGSGTKVGYAFGIKDQKFAYKNGISDEKTYLLTTLSL